MYKNNKEAMVDKKNSLQEQFLSALQQEKIPVAIYLINGIKLQGVVESFDTCIVMLKNNINQIVYKHAISTIVPVKGLQHSFDDPTTDSHD